MQRPHSLIPTLSALAFLSACVSSGDRYPTLEIRDAERVSGTFDANGEAEQTPTRAPPSADLIDRLTQLSSEAGAAHRAFVSAVPGTRNAVSNARNAAVASNGWAAAQIALSDLDSHRSRTAIALGDLDLIYADAALAFEQRNAIVETREAVLALIREEDAALAELRRQMAR